MKNRTNLFIVCFSLLFMYGAKRFCEQQTDGFTIARITSHLSNRSELPIPPNVEDILDQSFHYLGCGGQCFVFLSKDAQYVIKFFKQHTLGHLLWLRQLPLPDSFKKKHFKKITRCEKKLFRDFNSYQIAFDELKEESGLIFLHLTKTDNLKKSITIFDKLGISHVLHLDDYEFIIQRKAEPFQRYMKKLIANYKIPEAETALKTVLDLVCLRYQRGIMDEDPRLYNNIGFLDGRPIFMDAGRFKKDLRKSDPNIYLSEIPRFASHLKKWIDIEYPLLSPTYDHIINKIQND
ncbi:MAG TPA: hypothetical protein VLE96_04590 [Chlamydiales bacterium]|nr:hypothetical protein [Chlamydiales bacterium]